MKKLEKLASVITLLSILLTFPGNFINVLFASRQTNPGKESINEDYHGTVPKSEEKFFSKKRKRSRTKKASIFPFFVYKDRGSGNHFIPSGWMGDYDDIEYNGTCPESPRSGKTCIRISYSAESSQSVGWAGIYWQDPVNNWGGEDGGYDLDGARKVTFWARSETGTGVIYGFKVGGIKGDFPDTDVAGIGPVELTKEWKKYTINLDGKDLKRIAGGFCWAAFKHDNPAGFVMYLDDIAYER